MKIYVAVSRRNSYRPDVVQALCELDHDVYALSDDRARPLTENGYVADLTAMLHADCCVLILIGGAGDLAARFRAGICAGTGKPLLVLATQLRGLELLDAVADSVHIGLGPLLLRLQEIADAAE